MEINVALFHFSYSPSDKNSQPPAISLPKLRIQAAESWCLVRNLPLVADSKVPESDEYWQLPFMFLDCLDIIFAHVRTSAQADLLAYLILDHHCCFKLLYPNQKVMPKHHFMVHYPGFIIKFGPLSQYWCMHSEFKHPFGEELKHPSVHPFFTNL